jgi:circadian clock protein KaiB
VRLTPPPMGSRLDEPSSPAAGPPTVQLRLYVVGGLPNSVQAVENLRQICERHLEDRHTLEVVDFLEHPDRALRDGVLVTPTLLKLSPGPEATIIGTLSDRAAVLRALGLSEPRDE